MTEDAITRMSDRIVYRNRWMTVREDQVRFQDGAHGIYGVVEKEDFSLIVPRHSDGRYQMVQQFRYPVGARYWEFPQGSWETKPGTPPETVAMAELAEETGYRAGHLTPIGHLFEAYGFSTQGFHIFLATDLASASADRDAEEQDMITGAFTPDQVTTMIRDGAIKDAPTVAAFGLLALMGI